MNKTTLRLMLALLLLGFAVQWTFAQAPEATPESTPDAKPDEANPVALENCISVIGDSLAYGTAVIEVPGHGFPVIQTTPLAYVIDDALREREAIHIGVYNFALPETSLGAGQPYMESAIYARAVERPCRYTVILPWLNDLPTTPDNAHASAHIDRLATLVNALLADAPGRTIILPGYFAIEVTPLGSTIYGARIEAQNVDHMNLFFFSACVDPALLGVEGVSCLDLDAVFAGVNPSIQALTPADFAAGGYYAVTTDGQQMLNFYWGDNPGGVVRGDGVHLSAEGKSLLVAALLDRFAQLDPAGFDPLGG